MRVVFDALTIETVEIIVEIVRCLRAREAVIAGKSQWVQQSLSHHG